jgi:hypothetical protein
MNVILTMFAKSTCTFVIEQILSSQEMENIFQHSGENYVVFSQVMTEEKANVISSAFVQITQKVR